MEAHEVGQGVGKFGGTAQGDLLLVGRSSGFVVLVHGTTVLRTAEFRDPCG
ncbi:hypothetical protein NKH18_37700 [Streptomyces sp. M10(2022)]